MSVAKSSLIELSKVNGGTSPKPPYPPVSGWGKPTAVFNVETWPHPQIIEKEVPGSPNR